MDSAHASCSCVSGLEKKVGTFAQSLHICIAVDGGAVGAAFAYAREENALSSAHDDALLLHNGIHYNICLLYTSRCV